jgi:hypothetical protein
MTQDSSSTGAFAAGHGMPGHARDAVAAQHERFGGIKWGAAFFGWLSANGLAVLLLALLSATGVALNLTDNLPAADQASKQAKAIGIGGGVALLVLLALAYFAGGYVAARMARFDGLRQGLAVWLVGLLVVVLLAAVGGAFGAKYNVLSQLNLPHVPIGEGGLTTGGIIALVAVLITTLLAAILGGRTGDRYHRKIDRAGFDT